MSLSFRKYSLICWLVLSTFGCILLFDYFYDFNRGCDVSSMNDEWEHQTMAVNYAKGFGLYKLGAYSNIEDYHFSSYDATLPFLRKLITDYPTEYYHRAAGFSFIIGNLYKITGTHPYWLRIFNIILMICSWLILCYAVYKLQNNKSLLYLSLSFMPVFLILNFSYINLIGDDTMIILSLSVIFLLLIKWLQKPNILNSIGIIILLLISILIKSTLFFVPIFLFLFAVFIRHKMYIIHSILICSVLFSSIYFISHKINENHKAYKYFEQQTFHTDMMNVSWKKEDSAFVKQYHLKYLDQVRFDFQLYKKIATYLFERQFYTKKSFLLSGQSLFLMIDGNNEACALSYEKHIGSWKPVWKFNRESYFYEYDASSSAYSEILKFYFHKPLFFPLIMYTKLYAGYYWNYLFIATSVLQLFLCLLIYKKITSKRKFLIYLFCSFILIGLFYTLLLTPFIVLTFFLTFIYLAIQQKIKSINEKILFYLPYFFICYFIFLTLLMFGLNRYTCIVNGITLLLSLLICYRIYCYYKKSASVN